MWMNNTKLHGITVEAYNMQFLGSYCSINFMKLWKAKVEPKCRFFTLLWLQERLLTDDNLTKREIPSGDRCSLCDQLPETASHLVLACPYSRGVWHMLAQWTEDQNLGILPGQFATPSQWWAAVALKLNVENMSAALYTA
jgi:hypothetical protein